MVPLLHNFCLLSFIKFCAPVESFPLTEKNLLAVQLSTSIYQLVNYMLQLSIEAVLCVALKLPVKLVGLGDVD